MATPHRVACGAAHTAVIDTDGLLWVTGSNRLGQLGLGDVGEHLEVFTPVPGIVAAEVACGAEHTVVLDVDGRVWVAGSNRAGQLGVSWVDAHGKPFSVVDGIAATAIAAGSQHTVVLDVHGRVWVAGSNAAGQLGIGSASTLSPTPGVSSFAKVPAIRATAVAAGSQHTVLAGKPWRPWPWMGRARTVLLVAGSSVRGQLGIGELTHSRTFTKPSNVEVAQVAAGADHTVVVDVDGAVWVAGSSLYGQLGLTGRPGRKGFVQVPGITATQVACGIEHTAAVSADGTLSVVGSNSFGQLGFGCGTDAGPEAMFVATEFTPVPGITVAQVACGGEHTVVIDRAGRLWVAGRNDQGQLGCGFTDTSTFAHVEVGTRLATLASVLSGPGTDIGSAYEMAATSID